MEVTDLTPYSPRLLLQWEEQAPGARHRTIDGTLVFADVSGFTRLSERLARTRGKAGAEELTEIISSLFGDLLSVAARRGGEMLKFGGDAVLVFFRGDDHPLRAAAASWEMQRRLREIGRVETDTGPIRLRMSVGVHTGGFDLFRVGGSHVELVIAGPATTETVRVEGAADAGEVLLSAAAAATLDPGVLGAEKDGGRLLRRCPSAPEVEIVPSLPDPRAVEFVSVGLRDHLASGDVDPEHRLATVAFIHVMGLDGLLASGDASVVASQLDETVRVVQDACAEYGVSFLATDLAGDGTKVMAASGAPRAGDDDERRMLLALRRMVTAGTPLPIRAGAQRGHVFAAAVGPPFRKTYTTMGDVTNTAARVMGRAGAGEVLALRDVLDHVRGRLDVTELEPFAAKGKSELLVPYRIDGERSDIDATHRARLPLAGRDVELGCLLTAADDLRGGAGAVIEVVGDMGSGKSRLVDELLQSCPDLAVHLTACEPYERATPFHPIGRLFEQLLPGDLDDVVRSTAPELVEWLPLLAAVLDREVADTPATAALDPKYRLQRTAAVAVELLAALLTTPSVLVVEDTHWLDDASAAILRAIERAVITRPWILCVTRRDETSTFVPTSSSTLVHLAPLDEDALRSLVRSATEEAPLPPHRRDEIVSRSAGNPLYLTELLATADADGALPASLEAVIAAQIDELPVADRTLLRQAAVLGSRFGVELLAEVVDDHDLADADTHALAERLGDLVVPVDDRRLRFRHQLVRDVAYESLPFRRRRAMHAHAAAVIERLAADPSERAGILSLHFANAHEHERCWHYARIAAERAIRKHANVDAVQLLERALAAVRHLPLAPAADVAAAWESAADCRALLGELDLARDALRRARRLCGSDPISRSRLYLKDARLAERAACADAVVRSVRQALRSLDAAADEDALPWLASVKGFYAWFKHNQGRQRQARRWALAAIDHALASDNRETLAIGYMVLDGAELALGQISDPVRTREALAIWEEVGDLKQQSSVSNNLGAYAYHRGSWDEARRLYEQSRDATTRLGAVIEAASATFNIVEILVDQGRFDEAEPLLLDLASVFTSVGYQFGFAHVDAQLGRLHVHRGETDDAISKFERARSTFANMQQSAQVVEVDARLADCLLRSGDVAAARALASDALDRERVAGGTRVASALHRVLACCAAAEGDVLAASVSMEEALRRARASGSKYDVALALDGICKISRLVGGVGPGETAEAELLELATQLGLVVLPLLPIEPADGAARSRRLAVPAPG